LWIRVCPHCRYRRRNNRDRFDDFPGVRVDSEARVLPARVGTPLGVTSVLAAIALMVMSFGYAGESAGAAVDAGIRGDLRQLGAPWRQLALVVDWTAEPVGAVVVLAALLIVTLRAGNRRGALLAVAAPAAVVVVTTVMKPLVGRTINDGFLAFPSGHTGYVTACALVAMLVVARAGMVVLAVVTVAVAAAMAWAQVLLNAHYPTDTLGGFCAALAVVPAVAWTIDRLADARA
jgi:undecaprenyl-diphosphatase